MHIQRAYFNASGQPKAYPLTPDLKRAVLESKSSQGLIHVLSTGATTAVILMENHDSIVRELLKGLEARHAGLKDEKVTRRAGTGPDKYHLMALDVGLSLTVPFAEGRLLTNPQHEILALDFEPRAGRREFTISVLAEGGQPQR